MVHSLKIKKEYNNLKKLQIRYIYRTELGKACFHHDMSYGVLRDKTFNIAEYLKYDGYQRVLAWRVWKYLDKKILVEHSKMKFCLIKN